MSDAAMVPVTRFDLETGDIAEISELINRLYVQHSSRLRRVAERTGAVNHSVLAGPLTAGLLEWSGVEYRSPEASTMGVPTAMVAVSGAGVMTAGREELPFTGGDVWMPPPDRGYGCVIQDASFALVQVPWSAAAELAAEHAGIAGGLRFTAMRPVSAAAGAVWARTAMFVCGQLVTSQVTEVHPLVLPQLTRLAAAAFLECFPNTTMTAGYVPGPGWVPPAAVHRAVTFITEHAAEPVSVAQIAAAAGVTSRALREAFTRNFEITPAAFLRRARLERAYADLASADPGSGLTVTAVARRWGWASPSRFAAAYRQRFGVPPSQTLRS